MDNNAINTKVAQIVYNLKDYRKQKYLSTNDSNLEVQDYDTPTQGTDSKIKIYSENLFEKLNLSSDKINNIVIKKLGIQAPPGTKFKINGNKEMIMGRTGIYELDERFEVKTLQFFKEPVYELNEISTKEALEMGISQLNQAKKDFHNYKIINGLEQGELMGESNDPQIEIKPPVDSNSKEYWDLYHIGYREYERSYKEAYSNYLKGVNGIYDQKAPRELENIIIDFIYE